MLRAILCAACVGVATMATVADEPKKEEPKELKEGGITYNEKVTLKVKVEPPQKDIEFLNPTKDVWAARRDTKVGLVFAIRATTVNTTPTKGSIIIDKDGNEYEITESQSSRGNIVKLIKKGDPKKP